MNPPTDEQAEPTDSQTTVRAEFDYIVVGSGAGGGPLAANLAKAGHKVLLLEAGGAPEPYNYQIPAFNALASEDDSMKWDFFVRHYASDEQQKRDPKFVEKHNGVLYPRAGTLGGCTAHNAMVTTSPNNCDWDEIERITNDPSWGHDNMRKYFERIDNCHYRPIRRFIYKIFGWNPTRHGFAGWLPSSTADSHLIFNDKKLIKLVLESALETLEVLGGFWRRLVRGARTLFDPNDWRLVNAKAQGIRSTPTATVNGRRSGSREYIRHVQSEYPENLTLRTSCLVTKVLFDDQTRAIGVEYLKGSHIYCADPSADSKYCADLSADPKPVESEDTDKRYTARVRREVILSGGAFNTPQLLKLSGIGPREELEQHCIKVLVDLPGVGENLQDRYEVGIVNRMKQDITLLDGPLAAPGQGPPDADLHDFYEWQRAEGPYTSNGVLLSIIKKSKEGIHVPDLFILGIPIKFKGYYPGYSKPIATERNYFTWAIPKAYTNNRAGTVTLRSCDPREVPDINFNYFNDFNEGNGGEDDLNSVVAGVEFVRKMTRRYSELIEEEVVPGTDVQTIDEIKTFIKNQAWGHHASCSCKIGTDEDPMAVLDGNFRVRGTKNLRVVDASVFPRIPGYFIVSAVYMISEKASDVILKDANDE